MKPVHILEALGELVPSSLRPRWAAGAATERMAMLDQLLEDGDYPIPYVWGGALWGPCPGVGMQGRGAIGFDCSGLVSGLLARFAAVPLGYRETTSGGLRRVGADVMGQEEQTGDILVVEGHVRMVVAEGLYVESHGEGSKASEAGRVGFTVDAEGPYAAILDLGVAQLKDSRELQAHRRPAFGSLPAPWAPGWLLHLQGRGPLPSECAAARWRSP